MVVALLCLMLPMTSLLLTPVRPRHPQLVPHSRAGRVAAALDPESCDAELGWCVSSSGLKYVDDVVGGGEEPTAEQVVKVEYSGTVLSDGRKVEFPGAKSPLTFVLGKGVPLWEEAIGGMRIGGKRRLMVPPSAGLRPTAAAGSQGVIEEGETIRFVFELVGVETGASAKVAELQAWSLDWPALRGRRLSWQGALLLLSAMPYFFPSEQRPGPWQGSWGFFTGSWLGEGVEPPDIF